MSRYKVIGTGAAGNKALAGAIEANIVSIEDSMFLNTTMRDIDQKYVSKAIQIGDKMRGCGKERMIAKNLTADSLRDEDLNIDAFVNDEDLYMTIIVTSTSGGSGSGSATILAKYIKDVLGKNVMLFAFTGFEADGRELQNTIEFFQDIEEDFIVQTISNKKFLELAGGNHIEAEKLANEEFRARLQNVMGLTIRDSEQNIDDTDLYKLTTTPGFMDIEACQLPKLKNVEQFNEFVTKMIDSTRSLEFTPTCKRLGVILNVPTTSMDHIDHDFSVAKKRFGMPYEFFLHIQHEDTLPDFIAIIAAGMDLPLDDINEAYERYKELSSKVNKNKDGFFSKVAEMRGDNKDSMFNMDLGGSKQVNKKDFFSSLGGTKKGDPVDKY